MYTAGKAHKITDKDKCNEFRTERRHREKIRGRKQHP